MCQHYEAEARVMRGVEAYQRRLDHTLKGKLARQDGQPRSDWEALTYGVDHTIPDEPERYRSPSWWKAHHFDGPLIEAWLGGWDDEDARIAAGGLPMTAEERAVDEADLSFLGNLDYELRHAGHSLHVSAAQVQRLGRLHGTEDYSNLTNHQGYYLVAEAGKEWVRNAREAIEARLTPHEADLRARRKAMALS